MTIATAGILIIAGSITAILKGALNIGNGTGRSRRFVELVGPVAARVIYGVLGAVLMVVGIIGLFNGQG